MSILAPIKLLECIVLLVIRCILLAIALILVFIFGGLYCLLRPRHRNNVHVIAQIFSKVSPILGLKVEYRLPKQIPAAPNVFLANHQNNFDLFTHTGAVPKGTVSLGKKSLVWIPLFGQMYWLSGNILIDRKNRHSAMNTMGQVAEKIRNSKLSVWIFPEGTRSRGRGLLPFKSGAFHTAIAAGAQIVPVVSSCQQHVNLNRWNNGTVIIEMMEPIATKGLTKSDVKALNQQVHETMKHKYEELNAEAKL